MTSRDLRLLTADEVPLLLPLAREFFAGGEIAAKLNESHFVTTFRELLDAGNFFVIVAGMPIRGTIAGIIHRDPFGGDPICSELWWFVRKEERGSIGVRLLDAWEIEGKSRGAERLFMAHLAGRRGESLDKLFERRGYEAKEVIFVKDVSR